MPMGGPPMPRDLRRDHLGYHSESARLFRGELGIAEALVGRSLQRFEVLRQGLFIELLEKLRLGGDVVTTDIINELTFGHTRFSVGLTRPIT